MKKEIDMVKQSLVWFSYSSNTLLVLVLLLFCLTLSQPCFSQKPDVLPHQIDSLQQILNQLPENAPQYE